MSKKEHYLYKYVCNSEIIYIGKTDANLENRILQHRSEDKFKPYLKHCAIYCLKMANRTDTDCLEKLLINKYKPILNITSKENEEISIDFIEPDDWISFNEYLSLVGETKKNNKKAKIKKDRKRIELNNFEIEYRSKISQLLKNIRLLKNMSVETLCDKANISRATLWKIENNMSGVDISFYISVISALGMLDVFNDACDNALIKYKPYRLRADRSSKH